MAKEEVNNKPKEKKVVRPRSEIEAELKTACEAKEHAEFELKSAKTSAKEAKSKIAKLTKELVGAITRGE